MPNPLTPPDPQSLTLARQGWVGLACWMTLGFLLETLMAYKTPAYLNDPVRRELFRLAHTHGTLLNLLLILASLWSTRSALPLRRSTSLAFRFGSVLMPLGFLLAGVRHFESDPGFAIWLVPPGALLVLFATISLAVRQPSTKP